MKIFFSNGPAVFLSAIIFLIAAETVPAVQVKLNNGTVLNGDIVDQNEDFIVVQIGQAKLSIAKNMVSEIAGRPAGTGEGAASASVASATASGTAVSDVSLAKKVEITLNNGAKFMGAVVAMDNRVIEIETVDKSRLVFYKVNITDVRDCAEPSFAAVPSPAAVAPGPAPAAAAAVNSPGPAGEATPGKMVEITLKNGGKFKGLVVSADERHIMLEVSRGSNLDFYRNVIDGIKNLEASPVSGVQVTAALQPVPAVVSTPVKTANALSVPAAPLQVATGAKPPQPVSVAAAPQTPPSSPGPAGEATPGKMVEITLENGGKFKGLVVSADERHIMLEVSRGSNLDFYRNVIVGIKNLETSLVSGGQVTAALQPVPAVVSAPVKTASEPAVPVSTPVTVAAVTLPALQPVPAVVSASVKTASEPAVPASTPVTVAAVTLPAPQPVPAVVSAPVKTASEPAVPASTPVTVAAVTPPVPQPKALPVVQQKLTEGKNVIKLKNGVVLSGSIVSANDWYIAFSINGVTVNVLRRCMASVDGAANTDTVMPLRGTPAAAAPEKAQLAAGLVKAISDSSGEARKKAVAALGAMNDTIAVLPLIAALRDNDPAVRKAAAEALGDIRDPRAILPLCSALQDTVDSARAAIQFSLKLHSEIPLLIGTLDNRNTLVRDNAAYILWLLTGKNFGNDKQGWVNWYSAGR
jgi:sRNA-binding regulator protein Hfq